MATPEPLGLLQDGAASLGLDLAPATLEQFRLYLTELKRWKARINLTGLKTDQDVVTRGFLDSLAVLPFLEEVASLADLGSGAGFPGLVLKLVRPKITLTLVEAREKKAAFLEYLAARLELAGVEVARVHLTPALARDWGPRFATVISRAAFKLEHFLELAAPLLVPGGAALALKGPGLPEAELAAAASRAGQLGLVSPELKEYRLPVSGELRLLVVTRRVGDA